MKYVEYDEFVQIVNEQGKYVCFDYSEDVKQSIIEDFRPVFDRESEDNEMLKFFVDEIIETAKPLEIRVYPKNEFMLVRVEVRFRDVKGEFGQPYQLLAFWDCFYRLKAYTFVRGESQKSEFPEELADRTVRYLSSCEAVEL